MESLLHTLDKLRNENSSSKGRTELMSEMRRLISLTDFGIVPEKQIQHVLAILYSKIKEEKNALKRLKETSKAASVFRINQYGQTVRDIISTSLHHIKIRTLRSFLEHMLDTLPTRGTVLMESLATIYLKTLQLIVDYSPHLEHFDHSLWLECISFCINAVENYESLVEDMDTSDFEDSRSSYAGTSRKSSPVRSEVVPLMACLGSLVSWTAADFTRQSNGAPSIFERLAGLVLSFFERQKRESSAHASAFIVLKALMAFACSNNMVHARQLAGCAAINCTSLWNTRTLSLKEPMLACLMLCVPFFSDIGCMVEGTRTLENLGQSILLDLLSRPQRNDICLSDLALYSRDIRVMSTEDGLALRTMSLSLKAPDDVREQSVFTLQVLAHIYGALLPPHDPSGAQSRRMSDSTQMKKRRRLNEPIETANIFKALPSHSSRNIVIGLQVTTWAYDLGLTKHLHRSTIDVVQAALLSDSSITQSWAQLCLASAIRLASHANSDVLESLFSTDWLESSWIAALRSIASPTTSRSVCHLASSILQSGRLSLSVLGTHSLQMTQAITTMGPASCTDAACEFLVLLFEKLVHCNLLRAKQTFSIALLWLQDRLRVLNPGDLLYTYHEHILWFFLYLTGHIIKPDENELSCSGNSILSCLAAKLQVDATARRVLSNQMGSKSKDESVKLYPRDAIMASKLRPQPDDPCQSVLIADLLVLMRARMQSLITMLTSPSAVEQLLGEGLSMLLIQFQLIIDSPDIVEDCVATTEELCEILVKQMETISVDQLTLDKIYQILSGSVRALMIETQDQNVGKKSCLSAIRRLANGLSTLLRMSASSYTQDRQNQALLDEDFCIAQVQDTSALFLSQNSVLPIVIFSDVLYLSVLLFNFSTQDNSQEVEFRKHFLSNQPIFLINCELIWRYWRILPRQQTHRMSTLILQYLVSDVLQDYRYERNGSLLLFIAKLLSMNVKEWAAQTDSTGQKIFEWLIKIAISASLSAHEVRIEIVSLCRRVIEFNADHGRDDTQRKDLSTRSILVNTLRDHDLRVVYGAGNACTTIFHNHEVHTHDRIFDDIITGLPSDSFSIERLLLRSHILCLLAKHVEAPRTQAIYYLLELSQFPELHASLQKSLSVIATSLEMTSRLLLDFYHKSLICSWLQTTNISSFPYILFGFESLKEFITHYEGELVAQIISQGFLDQFAALCVLLREQEKSILLRNIDLVHVYSRIRLEGGQNFDSSNFIRGVLGVVVLEAMQSQDTMICTTFVHIHDCLGASRTLDKVGLKDISRRLDPIESFTDGELRAPAREPLQCTLRGFVNICNNIIPDKSLRISDRSMIKIVRLLLKDLRHGFPIRNSQALRKIGVLIAFTDRMCFEGYPLEVLLRCLCGCLSSSRFTLGRPVCTLILHLLSNTRYTEQGSYNIVFQATLFLLRFSSTVELSKEQLNAIHDFSSSKVHYRHNSVINAVDLGIFIKSIRPKAISLCQLQQVTLAAIMVFQEETSEYLTDAKRILIQLVAAECTTEMLRSQVFVDQLRSLIGSEYHPVSVDEVVLVNKLSSSVLYFGGNDQPKFKQDTGPSFSGFHRVALSQCVIRSLRSYDPTVAESAETTLVLMTSQADQLENEIPEFIGKCLPLHMVENDLARRRSAITDAIDKTSYSPWVKALLNLLLQYLSEDDFYFALARSICVDPVLCQRSLVHLAHDCLEKCRARKDDLETQMTALFQECFKDYLSRSTEEIKICLSVLEGLRSVDRAGSSAIAKFSWLQINYVYAAQAACHHEFLEDALLFLEILWLSGYSITTDIFISTQLRIYSQIEEPDSFYGVEQEPSLQTALVKAEYESSGNRALPMYTALQNADKRFRKHDSSELRHKIGTSLRSLALDTINIDNGGTSMTLDESKYESAWRLEHWDLPFSPSAAGCHQILYRVLCSLANVSWIDLKTAKPILQQAHVDIMSLSRQQSGRNVITASLMELEELLISIDNKSALPVLIDTWSQRSEVLRSSLPFTEHETLIAARQVYLDLRRDQSDSQDAVLKSQLQLLLVDYKWAVTDQNYQSILTATVVAEALCAANPSVLPIDIRLAVKALAADVLWHSGDLSSSVKLLQNIIDLTEVHAGVSPLLAAKNLLDIGLRMATGRFEKQKNILEKYLMLAIEILADNTSTTAGKMHLKFAAFCDEQLESLQNNEDLRRLSRLRNEKEREIEDLDHLIRESSTSEHRRRLQNQKSKAKALFEIDNAEYVEVTSSQNIYLTQSIESFLRAFAITDEGDTLVSRCSTLWFANSTSTVANEAFDKYVDAVPSYKFLIPLNQLLARLSATDSHFQRILARLLGRIATEHPYHALYVMYAVQYSKRSGDEAAKGRVKAMTKIIQKISTGRTMGRIILNVRTLCGHYIKLATSPVNKKDFPTKAIPFTCMPNHNAFLHEFAKMKLPPMTLPIAARSSRDYSDVPIISTYEKTFTLAGGISVPKVLKCRLSDGSICKELVKGGNDDLRQDVVMQQVFSQVDYLFRRNQSTATRKLKIRTYKVIPLATNAGVLQWVLETVPLQEFLEPLHRKYHPKDWSFQTCRSAISDVAKRSKQVRIEAYKTVMLNCQPAMKHAFIDMFNDAKRWHGAQLAYSRSTAAISIVGYILGLGDRHLHNIIVDKSNGEVVHIDLGIAFEQGKTLPIPELIPFRLTRDVVDGMGVLGTEGVFRRCCEFTLDVMRKEQGGIKSILDVLRHDPLYSWTVSPLQKHRMQDREGDQLSTISKNGDENQPEIGTEAARALLVVERKLSSTLSVSTVVSELIQEATDPEKLALIFAGWAAWY